MDITQFEEQITQSVEKLSESVVSIGNTGTRRLRGLGFAPFVSQGPGIIISSRGYIITNNHVVENAAKVFVSLKDGRKYEGSVMGADPATDVALIRIEADSLPVAKLGDSGKLKVGQIALAVGNALALPGAPTVSMGVISALGRPLPGSDFVLEGLIQTDAAINPGNSGGPLANLRGEVVGMNTAMIPYAQGVGFAIPTDTIKHVVEQILENGRVIRPWLGISGVSLNPAIAQRYDLSVDYGVLVFEVARYSPAHYAGLKPGDVVVAIRDFDVKEMRDLIAALSKCRVGEEVELTLIRMESKYRATIRLEEIPSEAVVRRH
jgi:serine protease Do